MRSNLFTKMVFPKKIELLAFMCVFIHFVQSSNLNRHESSKKDAKFHAVKNQNERQIMASLKSENTTNRIQVVKRDVPQVVNEDFELSPYIHHLNKSNSGINPYEDDEGSGIEEQEATITELYNSTLDYEYEQEVSSTEISTQFVTETSSRKTSTQSVTNKTEQILKTTSLTSTMVDPDGSGDGVVQVSVDDGITDTPASRSTPQGGIGQESIPDICMNSTCDVNELFVSLSEENNIIPEGTNFTFSCSSNYSDHMLYWYKSNGSVYFLQAFGGEKQLHLTLTDTKSIHSGKYICVHWVNSEKCCSIQSDIKVYKVPLYKYHMVIIGLIVVACLIICIVLSVQQSKTMKSYTKEFVKKHGSAKRQLL